MKRKPRTGPTPVGQRLRAQTIPAQKRPGPTASEWEEEDMIVTRYEGGIPYTEEVPDVPAAKLAAFERFLDSIPCSCKGEAHDECRPCAECGEAGAMNDAVDDTGDGYDYFCDECWEALVEEEERQYNLQRSEQEEFDRMYEEMREDHEAMRLDQWRQEQKEVNT